MFAKVLVALFVIAMIGVGIWGMKKTTTLSDFFLGGRSIGPWISAFSYGTAYFSAVLFIGFAGKLGWGFGLNVLWISVGNALFGSLLAWLVLGRRTRRMSQNLDVMTMPEFLYERYEAKYIKMISAAIIFIFLLPYSASVFKGLGHLFEINFGISYHAALLLMVTIAAIYLVMGGYFAVSLNDFIQGIIMIIGSILMVGILINKGGGLSVVISEVALKYNQHVPVGSRPGWLLLASLVFMTSFGTWGLPQMIMRYYAIKDESMIKKGAIVSFCFAVVIVFSAYFTGAMSHVFMDSIPVTEAGAPIFDMIIPVLLQSQLPATLMAIIVLLVLSASMSTLSSLVLVSASSVAIDMYKGHINTQVSKENSVIMMRFLCIIFIGISYLIARYEFALIVTLMSLSWGAVAGSFMAQYLYSLYWKGTTRAGAYAGVFTGLILAVSLFFILGPAKSPIASSIAMIVPLFVVPLVSLFTKKPNQLLIKKAFDKI